MKRTQGILLGFAVGMVIGLLVYLRWQRIRREGGGDSRYLRLEIDAQSGEGASLEAVAMRIPAPPAEEDDLERIQGIGPAYAQRLHEAGVHTFADLAAQNPQSLKEIIGPRVGPEALAGWIAEAGRLARRSV